LIVGIPATPSFGHVRNPLFMELYAAAREWTLVFAEEDEIL
jgi:hypothetical protein